MSDATTSTSTQLQTLDSSSTTLLQKFANCRANMWNFLRGIWQSMWQKLCDFVVWMWQKLCDFVLWMWQRLCDSMRWVWQWLCDSLGNCVGWLGQLPGTRVQEPADLESNLLEIAPQAEPEIPTPGIHWLLFRFVQILVGLAFIVVFIVLPCILVRIEDCTFKDWYMTLHRAYYNVLTGIFGLIPICCLSKDLVGIGLRSLLGPEKTDLVKPSLLKCKDIPWILLILYGIGIILKVLWEYHYISLCHGQLSRSVLYAALEAFSWISATATFVSSCILYSAICKYQITYFNRFRHLLVSDSNSTELLQEHIELCVQLAKISKSFQLYIFLQIVINMVYLVVLLLEILEDKLPYTYDFLGLGLFLIAGLGRCLNGAANVSEMADGVVSLASTCNASVICADGDLPKLHSLDLSNAPDSIKETITLLTNLEQQSSTENSNQEFQAFVMHLQNNRGGLEVYCWRIDRGFVTTILTTLFSLVLFAFGCSPDWHLIKRNISSHLV